MSETKQQRKERLSAALDSVILPNDQLRSIISNAIKNYTGNMEILQAAIGCLFLSIYLGRRTMQVVHSPRTIRRYEAALGIKFKELSFIPETTENSSRSLGYQIAIAAENFWDYVRGSKPSGNDHLGSLEDLPQT